MYLKQVAVEFTGYPNKVSLDINSYLDRNPNHRITSMVSSPLGALGQVSVIAVVEGRKIKSTTTLKSETFFSHAPFPLTKPSNH